MKTLYKLSEHDFEIVTLDFSHDDRLLLSTGNQSDGKLFIWDMNNGFIVATTTLTPSPFITALKDCKWGGFTKDIKGRSTTNYQFASCGSKKISIWSLDPYAGKLNFETLNTSPIVRDYTCVCFSYENEKYLFAGTSSGDLCIFLVKTKSFISSQILCTNGINVIVTISKEKICTAGGDGNLTLLSIEEGNAKVLSKIELCGSISAMSISHDCLQIIAGTNKGFIYRVRTTDLSRTLQNETHIKEVVNGSFIQNVSDKVLTCSVDGTMRLWDLNDYSAKIRCSLTANGYPMCCYLTDEIILSGWSDGKIRSFLTSNGNSIWGIDNAHKNGVTTIELSHNQKFIISGGVQGELRIWEIKVKEMVSHLKEHTSKVSSLYLMKDDLHAISCSRDKSILVWDLKTEKRVAAFNQSMGGINSMAVFNDEMKLISTGQDRKITYWDLRQSNPIKIFNTSPLQNQEDEIMNLSLSSDNKMFATVGSCGIVRLWDYSTSKVIAEGKGHSGSGLWIGFTPDQKQVISGGNDGLTVIWNIYL